MVDVRQRTATTRNQTEICSGNTAMERGVSAKLRQSSRTDKRIELKMQLLRSCWTKLSFKEQLTWRKLLTWTDYLSRFRQPQSQTRSCLRKYLAARSTRPIRLMTKYTKKTDFTTEQPMHQTKVQQKPNFIVPHYYASLCMDLECKLFFLC